MLSERYMNQKNHRLKNIHVKKKLGAFAVAVFLGVSVLFSGCSDILSLPEEPSEPASYFPPGSETESESSSVLPGEPESSSVPGPESDSEKPSETITTWSRPETLPDYSGDLTPEISTDREFNDYMDYILRNRIESFSFYAIDGFSIDNDLLLYRFSLPYVSTHWTKEEEGRVYWDVFLMYYPGTKIADAYEAGNISGLTTEEIMVHEIARDFIENKVNPEENILVKERLIHDFICYSTVYTNPGSNDPVPRYCTATGLFLDGEANCQGYVDAFNMLCRMAGLQSRSQSGSADGSLHVWNIFLLDNTWYAVDVTYDDTSFDKDGNLHPAYIYFNAGKDILEQRHYIPKGNELTRISKYSDENYLYYSDVFSDSGYFIASGPVDTETAEQGIADLLTAAYYNDGETISYLIRGLYVKAVDIVYPVQDKIADKPNPITLHTYHLGQDTYVCGETK